MNDCPPRDLVAPYMRPMTPEPTRLLPRGALVPPIQCLLCDLYGTLFISSSGDSGLSPVSVPVEAAQSSSAGLDALLARYGCADSSARHLTQRLHAAIAEDHTVSRARGISFPEVRIDRIWRQLLPELDHAAIRRFAVEYEMQVNPVWPMPHLEALLAACRKRGIALGIISNAQFFTPCLFEWFLGRPLDALGFDRSLVFFSYQHGRAKPSASLFQMALAQLARREIPARRTAYVGNDMSKDVAPAGGLGMQTVLFAGDARSLRMDVRRPDATAGHSKKRGSDQCREAVTPDLVVTDLSELITWLTLTPEPSSNHKKPA